MKKTYACICLVAIAGFCVVSGAAAGPYGENITIFDNKSSTTGDDVGLENNEAEPGMVQTQPWDLEGFFLNGSVLTLIGGYDFINGYGGYTSGDIFISTDDSYGYAAASAATQSQIISSPTDGYQTYSDNFGYEYVLDVTWDGSSAGFDIRDLQTGGVETQSVWFEKNETGTSPTSNPYLYFGGGSIVQGGEAFVDLGEIDGHGFSEWTNNGDDIHYAVSFDLAPLLTLGNLWGSELFFHFTMGCGNDNMIGQGTAPVPEPATMLLFGTGLAGLAGRVIRKRHGRKLTH
jgi:hypothetical protein